jgi:WhiB family redox-sensing transcriptional regulator
MTAVQFRPNAVFNREAWRERAACAEVETGAFFPLGQVGAALEQVRQAKRICCGCPVRDACLDFAITTNQEYGVWGGADEEERRSIRRQRRRLGRRSA